MSLYHEAAEFLVGSSSGGGSLKSRVFKKKNLKSSPSQLYALVLESCKWSPVIKEVIEKSDLLKLERKVGTSYKNHPHSVEHSLITGLSSRRLCHCSWYMIYC